VSAIEVASLFATLSLNDTMTRGLQNAGREADGFGRRLQNIGSSVTGFGAGMAQAFSPVTNFLTEGIGVAADFEGAMNEIAARTGMTGDELDRVRLLSLQMGADTAFSAQQAADAFLELISSGQTLEEAMATLPTVLTAAAASGSDLGTTADNVTNIMSMFGLAVEDLTPDVQDAATQMGLTREEMEAWADGKAPELTPMMDALATATGRTTDELAIMIGQEDAADVVNSLAKAAGASSATMDDLTAAFTNVGPVAAQFGLSVDDTAAALAVLADNGIKGSDAGTALKSMLLQMAQTTPATTAAWDELGVSLYDSNGDVRNMDTVLGELNTALSGLPVEDQNRLMQQLAGSYGITALSALLNANGIGTMKTAMDDAAGAAEVAEARMSGWQGANDALKGSLETLQIQVLTPLLENVLTPMVQKITDVVNQFTAWATQNPELANTIVTILAALAVLIGVLVPLGVIISTVGTVVGALGAAFGAAQAAAALLGGGMMATILPILAVGAAIAAVIAQVQEFNRIVGAAAAAAGQAAVSVGADQLAIDYAAWQATGGNDSNIPFAYRTALEAGLPYDFNQANANWAAFNAGQTPDSMRPRAMGGPVSAGSPYLIGERGPELFVPSSSGTIVPNHALGGGGQPVVVYVNNYGSSPYEFAELVERSLRDRGL
jgi:TP901 family phage tail tape measure protein